MRPLRLISILLSVVVLICFSGFSAEAQSAVKGVADLRNQNIWTGISLNGEWRFSYGELLTPEAAARQSTFFNVPGLWKKSDSALSAEGYATYSLTVLLPHGHPQLALSIPDAYTAMTVFLNGKQIFRAGKPGTNESNSQPHWTTGVIPVEENTDTLLLTLHISNFWHSKGGLNENFVIGDRDYLLLNRRQSEAFDIFLTGCLFMGGLFFFGLYLFGKHDRAILFFSLFCMVYSYRIIGTDMYTLHSIFPDLSWFFTVRLEYVTLYASIGLFVQYTSSLYPEDVNKKLMWILTAFCGIFALSVLLPPAIFTKFINPFLVVMFAYIAYALYVYLQAVRKKRIGSVYALLSTAVVLFVFALINLSYFQIIPSFKGIVFVGYIAFFFLQSLILSYRFATTLKIAKQQAEEGLQAKSSFLSTISHEIRTPLNSVIGTAHIMLKNEPRNDQKKLLDILLFSANNLLGLVNDVLDFNKIEANKINFEKIPMRVDTIVSNVVASLEPLAAEKKLRIEFSHDKIPTVSGDPMRLSQIMTNLIHNAVKFTDAGTIRVRVEKKSSTSDKAELSFSVEDTGIGIAQNKQLLIFDQFTQADSSTSRSFGGTGLGLAITKKIIEQLGGTLGLKSSPGEGSTFYFTLTFDIAADSIPQNIPMQKPDDTETLPLQNTSILLVEDNDLNIFVAQSFLEKWGAIITVAFNGKEAVEILATKSFDIILMDMHMPVMDGYEAVAITRSRGIQTPIIALTASISKESESRVMNVGANGIIVKPFEPDALLSALQNFAPRR